MILYESTRPVVLDRRRASPRGVSKFPGDASPYALFNTERF